MKYFAFGSNMSRTRLKERGIIPTIIRSAWLDDYELVFNKKSKNNNQIGFANIEYKETSTVYGILYWITEEELKKLDKFGGHPIHYIRKEIQVGTPFGDETAITYIAQNEWVDNSCKPTKQYIDFLIEGQKFIPIDYVDKIKNMNGRLKTMSVL